MDTHYLGKKFIILPVKNKSECGQDFSLTKFG
ncbi:MAG: hypothetical protein PWQ06_197 [Anaerophaga sp.]|nr:hypothetical protein [Anaerophaga sp.]